MNHCFFCNDSKGLKPYQAVFFCPEHMIYAQPDPSPVITPHQNIPQTAPFVPVFCEACYTNPKHYCRLEKTPLCENHVTSHYEHFEQIQDYRKPAQNNPVLTNPQTGPVIKQPAPMNNQPAPANNRPATVNNQPAPANNPPAPANNPPAPANNPPAPVNNQPAPLVNQPTPVNNPPAPVINQPAPVNDHPPPFNKVERETRRVLDQISGFVRAFRDFK